MGNTANEDNTMGGSVYLQSQLRGLIKECRDILIYSVKCRSMDVPPMEFAVNTAGWETNMNGVTENRLHSAH